MATLQDRVQSDLVAAMKAREKQKLAVLRMLSARIKDAAIEKRSALDDAEVQKLLLTYAKQREDGKVEAAKAGRPELVEQEEFELQIVRAYLPEPLSDDELTALVRGAVEEIQATSMKDMGQVMKLSIERAAGRADGNRISAAVKSILSAT